MNKYELAVVLEPTDEDVKGFKEFAVRYKNGLPIEKAAVEYLKY